MKDLQNKFEFLSGTGLKQNEKNKKVWRLRNGESESSGEGSSGLQSQESQELTAAAAAADLMVQNSSETHCVNVTNEDMGNRYLRGFHHVSHFLTHITTWSLTYMSVQTCKRAELRGYMWGCVRSTETQRIRTATKFAGPSAGHSERAIRSSVTEAVPLIVVQPSRIALTIGADTLCLSITAEKTTVVPGGMVLPAAVHLYQPPCWFSNFAKSLMMEGS